MAKDPFLPALVIFQYEFQYLKTIRGLYRAETLPINCSQAIVSFEQYYPGSLNFL